MDYSILFCEQIANLSPEEETWIAENLRPRCEWEALTEEQRAEAGAAFSTLHTYYAQGEAFPEFEWILEDDAVSGRRLRMWSDAFGSADHVADVVEAFLTRFRSQETFALTWVETCLSARPGAFGGGAIIVSATARQYHSIGEWLDLQRGIVAATSASVCDKPAT